MRCAGRLPFLGPDFVAQHLGEPAPAASSVAADIEPGWDELLARLLVKNPLERTPTLAELRAELEALDLGGRPQIGPRAKRTSAPHSIAALALDAEDAGPRYQFETPLGTTAVSQLARAVDTVLDRSVVIETFLDGDDATRALDHARGLGRAQSPFVQRALSFNRAARTVIFEAPSGATLGEAPLRLPAADAVRLLKRLARGAAELHRVGTCHGAIGPATVVFDEGAVPTMLCAGIGQVGDPQPSDDVAAIVAIVAAVAEAEPTTSSLASAVCDQVGARIPAYAVPTDGESLYSFADALDIAVLGALGAR